MKKIYLLCIPILCLLWRCSENDRMIWDSKAGVYFPEYTATADSLLYSFRISGLVVDTIQMQVKLQGALLEQPQIFRVVVDARSTGVAGTHFEPLKDSYVFPAHAATMQFPVVLLKKGKELDDKTISIILHLQATDQLDAALPDQVKARLLVTNQLIKPSYWDDFFYLYFGDYSVTKHLKCIEIAGHDFPLKEDDTLGYGGVSGYTYWMRLGREVCNYYATHTEYDENNDLIITWDPF